MSSGKSISTLSLVGWVGVAWTSVQTAGIVFVVHQPAQFGILIAIAVVTILLAGFGLANYFGLPHRKGRFVQGFWPAIAAWVILAIVFGAGIFIGSR